MSQNQISHSLLIRPENFWELPEGNGKFYGVHTVNYLSTSSRASDQAHRAPRPLDRTPRITRPL